MVQMLIQVDEQTARELEALAPARGRKRSEFIRQAIRQAIWAAQEKLTEEAYRRLPDEAPSEIDPRLWESARWELRRSRRRASARKRK